MSKIDKSIYRGHRFPVEVIAALSAGLGAAVEIEQHTGHRLRAVRAAVEPLMHANAIAEAGRNDRTERIRFAEIVGIDVVDRSVDDGGDDVLPIRHKCAEVVGLPILIERKHEDLIDAGRAQQAADPIGVVIPEARPTSDEREVIAIVARVLMGRRREEDQRPRAGGGVADAGGQDYAKPPDRRSRHANEAPRIFGLLQRRQEWIGTVQAGQRGEPRRNAPVVLVVGTGGRRDGRAERRVAGGAQGAVRNLTGSVQTFPKEGTVVS